MCVGPAIATSLGNNADGTSRIYLFLRRHHKAVQPRLTSKRIEFDTVKIRIVECFPHAEELDGVSVAKPVLNNVAWIITSFAYDANQNRLKWEMKNSVPHADMIWKSKRLRHCLSLQVL